MGAPRRKNLIAHRRRTDDDGEEEGDLAATMDDDSSSQGSIISDLEDDADAEGSESSEVAVPSKLKRKGGDNKVESRNGKPAQTSNATQSESFNATMTDTEAMMNGLNVSDNGATVAEIQFDAPDVASVPAVMDEPASDRPEGVVEKKRREHEEYKKQRDANPAFVPNRGGFFMHDHRSNAPGQNGFKPSGRGRGRGGRGGIGGPFLPSHTGNVPQNPSDAPWAHDLHESVATEDNTKADTTRSIPSSTYQKPGMAVQRAPPPNRTFSRTTQIGNIQFRMKLPGMENPITFSAVPVHQHTRLPHHRPPLRRDKPVRISLPDHSPRYIFPAVERSFIFIPRALRPNQQGFHRGRGRGSFGGMSTFASNRNSLYGGSVYSPSVAMSRRSSMAREMGRDGMVSPAASVMSRNRSIVDLSKPVVRLPPQEGNGQFIPQQFAQGSFPNTPAPIVNLPMAQAYPLPQNPLSTETLPSSLPMHQPRPQKAVSVAGIESPADQSSNYAPPQPQQQQPFHQQVPMAVNGQGYPTDPNMYAHSRHPSHPSQHGTPLSQIPERAIHAQPFQPYPYQQAPAYYPQQYPGPVYYYPSPAPPMAPSMGAPAFVPGQQYSYMMPAAPAPMPEPTTQSGTIAYESNGTVYYQDSSQLGTTAEDSASSYPQMAYAPPPNGYMIHQPAAFYPPQ